MKKIFFLAMLLLWTKAEAQELTVGDTMPDLKDLRYFKDGKYIDIELNWNSPEMKDKLVIFDFWATGCSSCIAGLPKMDSLQKKFQDKIRIIPIMAGPKKIVEDIVSMFWTKNSFCKRSAALGTLVEAHEKKILYKYFPNAGLPYEVWIKNGKVIAMTGAERVNESEINSVLNGDVINWPISPGSSLAKSTQYDFNTPLIKYFTNGNATSNSDQVFYSIAGGHIHGKFGSFFSNLKDKNRLMNRLSFVNVPILHSYRDVFRLQIESGNTPLYDNRVLIEAQDKSKFIRPKTEYRDEWKIKHTYSYELVLPLNYSENAIKKYLINDLNRFFNINGRVEDRKVKCWVISRNANKPKVDKAGVKKFYDHQNAKRPDYQIYSIEREEVNKLRGWGEYAVNGLSDLIARLNYESPDFPVLDESGYMGELAFILRHGPKITIEDYQKQLAKNGFDLKVSERDLKMLVITENDFKPKTK